MPIIHNTAISYLEQQKGSGVMFRKLYGFIFDSKPVLSGYRGSIAHNLHIPREKDDVFGIDDIDLFEIYCYPLEYYISLEGYYHSKEVEDKKEGELDTVKYEIRKAFHLLSVCNPNVLLFLYNSPENYTHISKGGKLLLKHKDIFLSRKKIRDAFIGYAYDQLNKLTTGVYKGYMGEKRRNIVDKFGYDTKNATTLIRLLRQGKEFLLTGNLKVFRDNDREFLLEIKKGKFTLNQIQDMSKMEISDVDEAYKKSKIQEENNKTKTNELLIDIIRIENELL